MTKEFLIERAIEIDAGHRVTHHGSKCRNLHGHRYKIIAVCRGPLAASGEQEGMVLDFGFLKEEMMAEIHTPCDHAMILGIDDPLTQNFVSDPSLVEKTMRPAMTTPGFFYTEKSLVGALYVMPCVPTAENLAAHWFKRMQPRVSARSNNQAQLVQIKVYETPNCMAAYPASMN